MEKEFYKKLTASYEAEMMENLKKFVAIDSTYGQR